LLIAATGSLLLYFGWAARFLANTESSISLVAALLLGAIFTLPVLQRGLPPQSKLAATSQRIVAAIGTVAPFFAALGVAADTEIGVAPPLLVAYLALLSIGIAIVSAVAEIEWLSLVSPLLSMLAMVARLDEDWVPAQRTATLAWFIVPAAIALALSVVATRLAGRRKEAARVERPLRIAAGVALALGAAVVGRVVALEPTEEPIAPLALFMAPHVLGLIALAAVSIDATWLVVADGASLVTMLALWRRFDDARSGEFVLVTAVFMLTLWCAPLVLAARRRAGRLSWIASGVALLLHFPLIYMFARASWSPFAMAAAALGCALLATATLRLYLRAPPETAALSRGTIAALGAITLSFVTAAVPIALENQWITVAWAGEAAALAWLRRRVEHEGLVVGSTLLAGATFIRLVANPRLWAYGPTGGIVLVNWLLYAFGIPIVCFFAAAHWLRGTPLATRLRLPLLLTAGAGVLSFVLMNAEIADAFAGTIEGGLRFSGQSVLEDMIYSLGWGLFALATLIIGIARRSRVARAAALGVLVLTFAKVFLHDLWQLGSLYRVGSMIGLAVALLAVSFLLQRFVLRAGADPRAQPEART
ncbi:MAG TPA: DUF2339 domain-containing protein, partial [Polyangiaceae bacterium]